MVSERLSDRLAGRWTEVLPLVGVPFKLLNGKNQPCPFCGGKDRFRCFKRQEGLFICTHCGSMNGITLAMRLTGVAEFRDMARKIEAVIGKSAPPPPHERSDLEKRKALNDLWKRSVPVTPNSPAGRYLTARTGMTVYPSCLRAVDEIRWWSGDRGDERYFPGLLARVQDSDGKPVNIHRTYLTTDGRKAPVDPPRRMMPGPFPKRAAVRLSEPGRVLGVAEGLETAISASLLHGVPVWSVLGTFGMATWEPPRGVEVVKVFGDNDNGFAGQAAAYTLAYRLLALPARPLRVEVLIDGHQTTGRDWNDVATAAQVHLEGEEAGCRAGVPAVAGAA